MCETSHQLTVEEFYEETNNPKYCGCCKTICEEVDVIDHICTTCRGE